MNTPSRLPTSLLLIPLLLTVGSPVRGQWTGAGAGGAGTDINTPANWTATDINGDFSGNTSGTTLSLSDDLALSGLNFAWAASGLALVINGDGSGANEVITLNGDITVRRASSGSASVTFGSDVTLDFGTFSSNRGIAAQGSGSNYGSVVINGVVTGTATESAALEFGKSLTTVSVSLLNDTNSFTAPIIASGSLHFTSVSNVGEGVSALGSATTVENGTITLRRNATLNYVGLVDQSTDRRIVLSDSSNAGPITIRNESAETKITYTSEVAGGTYGNVLNLRAVTGATLEISGQITNTDGNMRLGINSGSGELGTVILSNAANEYQGRTDLINGGVLEVVKLADGGEASSIGMSSSDAANLTFGDWDTRPTLRYIGTGDSTDRLFTMVRNGAVIESSGTGAVHFTNTGALSTAGASNRDATTRTLTLGGTNTDGNTFASALVDHTYGSGSVTSSRLFKSGAGRWALTGTASTYTGITSVQGGILEVAKLADGGAASSIGAGTNAASNLVIHNNAMLRYTGSGDGTDRLFQISSGSGHDQSATIESSGTGALAFTNTGNLTYGTANQRRVLVLAGTNTGDNTFASTIANNGTGSGVVRVTKDGAGKWVLTGTNTYTGATTVNDGTLLLDGTLTSAVTVNAGVFGGEGSTTGNVTIGNSSGVRDALLAAGAGAGGFTTTGSLAFNADAEFAYTFDSTLGVAATATVSASSFAIHDSAFFTFNDIGNGSSVSVGDAFVILASTDSGSITGTFANLSEGGTFTASNITWRASYLGGDGNDLTLTALSVSVIPEPSGMAVLAGLAAVGLAAARRSRRLHA